MDPPPSQTRWYRVSYIPPVAGWFQNLLFKEGFEEFNSSTAGGHGILGSNMNLGHFVCGKFSNFLEGVEDLGTLVFEQTDELRNSSSLVGVFIFPKAD